MGKNVFKLKIINKTNENELFYYWKEYIKDSITNMVETFIDFDLNLTIIVKEFTTKMIGAPHEDAYGGTIVRNKNAEIILNIDALRRALFDEGITIDTILTHELVHVYDIINLRKIENSRLKNVNRIPRTFKDYCINVGFRFWTEFFAYYITFAEFKKTFNYPTFLSLVKDYKDIKELYGTIELTNHQLTKEEENAINKMMDAMDGFAYAIAKNMAGSIKGKPKKWEYCEKTKDKDYEEVAKIYDDILKLIIKFFHAQYSKWTENRLAYLGLYIIKNIYGKFSVWPARQNGRYNLAFYLPD